MEADPGWAAYQAKTARVIPVVVLHQVEGGPPNATSWGAALKLVHDAFRRELALIRDEVARSGPGLGAQLRVNCLTVCQGLHHHHTNEDAGMFAALDTRRPDLASTLERLRREHRQIAALVARLQQVISATDADPVTVRREVERLTAEVEDHLTYEEEQLIPVLDAPTG
ncbi:hemerythrin domain-containing protein [Micromonospora phytophila]|uniref:hemerythrin domain-containing protein n=1 Tax=Micromonospora phytophila TaxID=709888 RepID=UPI0035583718